MVILLFGNNYLIVQYEGKLHLDTSHLNLLAWKDCTSLSRSSDLQQEMTSEKQFWLINYILLSLYIYIQNYDWLLIELELPLQFWFQVSTYSQTPNLGKSHWPIHFRCFLVWTILLVQLSDPCKRWNICHIVQYYLCTFDEAKLP